MIAEKTLVLYKTRPALVSGRDNDKILISIPGESASVKVREKDVDILHPGPGTMADLAAPQENAGTTSGEVRSAWELIEASGGELSLMELSELVYDEYSPRSALAAWKLLQENLFFTGDIHHIKARSKAELESEEKKRNEKEQETRERDFFLGRLRKKAVSKGDIPLEEQDRRFLRDVEALARGRADKSRTLKELGWSETPVEAHRLLLSTGAWTVWENPHPPRFGISLSQAKIIPPNDSGTDRVDLTELPAFAIDNSWSSDPDDAVSLEGPDKEGRLTLWVHVADPAASVTPGSPADREALTRGATLYLPEGAFRMLAPETLPLFALGFGARESPALSFKITLNPDYSIGETGVFLSWVKVTRYTYEEADALISGTAPGEHSGILNRLAGLAEQNTERRLDSGAVIIELPEVHIHAEPEKGVTINQILPSRSADLVRECMLLAGEGAARWAIRNRVPIPFISQEAGELPETRLPGLAGAWQLRRSMRPRFLSIRPGVHWGLGLDMYTQATSPLRRYTDLLVHQQIRAFLADKILLSEDEVLLRATAAEAAAAQAVKAERASRAHWTSVFLADKIGSTWEGIILNKQGGKAHVIIPDLGIETQVNIRNNGINEKVQLTCLSVKIPEGEAIFAETEAKNR